MFKFQLPLFKGTELFPGITRAPTVVRVNVIVPDRVAESNEQQVAAEARRILDANRGGLLAQYSAMRQRADLSGLDYMKPAPRPFPGGDMQLSINFGQEILTLNVYPQVTFGDEISPPPSPADFVVFNSPLAEFNSFFTNPSAFYTYDFFNPRIDILLDGRAIDIEYELPYPPPFEAAGGKARGYYKGQPVVFAAGGGSGYYTEFTPLVGGLTEIYLGRTILVDLRTLSRVASFSRLSADFFGSWERISPSPGSLGSATPENLGAYAWAFVGSTPDLSRDWANADVYDVFFELSSGAYRPLQKRVPVSGGDILPVYPSNIAERPSRAVKYYTHTFDRASQQLESGRSWR